MSALPVEPERIVTTDLRWNPPAKWNVLQRFALRFLKDPRDMIFVDTGAEIVLKVLPLAALLFIPGVFRWWMAPIYLFYTLSRFMARYVLMLHATLHRPIFKKEYDWMNSIIAYGLGPFMGQTPTSFFSHHIGMHHIEDNQPSDLSSTMPYRRDSFTHWLHYWARFYLMGTVHMVQYFYRTRRSKIAKKLVFGELLWLGLVLACGWVNWQATVVVFVIPLMMFRVLCMMGNWAQHSFVDVNDSKNPYRSASTLMNNRSNHLCYNDGYHVVHHLKPNLHWSEMPGEWERTQEEYGRQDAVVFSKLANNQAVWWCLMTGNYERLADHIVLIGPQKSRSREEVIAWLKSRTQPQKGRIKGIFELEGTTPVARGTQAT